MASGGLPHSISWYSVRYNSCLRVVSWGLLDSIDLRCLPTICQTDQHAGSVRSWVLFSAFLLWIRIPDFPGYDAVVLLRVLEGMDEQIVSGLVGPLALYIVDKAIHEIYGTMLSLLPSSLLQFPPQLYYL